MFDLRATFCIFAFFLLAGCANEPSVPKDITLANASPVATQTAAPTRGASGQTNATQTTGTQALSAGSTVVTGSGATVNVISQYSSDTSPTTARPASDKSTEPVATASPVRPARLATAVMIEPQVPEAQAAALAKANDAGVTANSNKKIASRVLTLKRVKPDCKGSECPVLNFKQLTFTGYDRFNSFLEQTLLSLALLETNRTQSVRTLAELEMYFFKTAQPRHEIALAASIKFQSEEVIVIQLDSYIFTGGAHGISTTQYLNWLPKTDKLLTLETMLLPGQAQAFEGALKKQHALWLKKNELAKKDPEGYNKLWPFEPSDNVALLENGLAVTYDPYLLAPYSFGKPTIYIPFRELKGILRPELLPKT